MAEFNLTIQTSIFDTADVNEPESWRLDFSAKVSNSSHWSHFEYVNQRLVRHLMITADNDTDLPVAEVLLFASSK